MSYFKKRVRMIMDTGTRVDKQFLVACDEERHIVVDAPVFLNRHGSYIIGDLKENTSAWGDFAPFHVAFRNQWGDMHLTSRVVWIKVGTPVSVMQRRTNGPKGFAHPTDKEFPDESENFWDSFTS
jgi:hypothetical protein